MIRIESLLRTVLSSALPCVSLLNLKKKEILNYLETTEEADLIVRGLMTGSQSVTSFILSLLQAAHVKRDSKK